MKCKECNWNVPVYGEGEEPLPEDSPHKWKEGLCIACIKTNEA